MTLKPPISEAQVRAAPSNGSAARTAASAFRLRSQRIGLYAGQSPQQPTTVLEQAEGLIASLPLDQRRRLIERLLANMPPDDPESEPALPLELTTAAPKNEPDGFVKFSISVTKTKTEP